MVGNSPNEDTLNGFFMPVKKQIELVCKTINEDPKLQKGFNGMGFSQGGHTTCWLHSTMSAATKDARESALSVTITSDTVACASP